MRNEGFDSEMTRPRREPRQRSAGEALSALMRLCSRAERSSGDAMRLMRQWSVAENEREGVLRRLVEMKFIDDSRYAEAFVGRRPISQAGASTRFAWHCNERVYRAPP